MTSLEIPQNLVQMCNKHNQKHLFNFWQKLSEQQKKSLLEQIANVEWQNIDTWIENYIKRDDFVEIPTNFEPSPYYPAEPLNDKMAEKYAEAHKLGSRLIQQGKVAAFMVAGGQGTRLGYDGPKGNFPISPIRNKTLFQIFAENIIAAQNKYKSVIPWYIMTSPLNNAETIKIFQDNNYYGLKKEDVFFFIQGTMPNFDFQGRILLSDLDTIACSPDGHGGSLKALYKSGAIADMQKRNVEQISYFQVDNPLINIIDPLFIGLHAIDNAQMSSKTLKKAYPKEKVGNFCLVNGRVCVIEYSDLPDELAEKTNADGSLVFELGSIAIHIISTDFVEKLNKQGFALPFHRAIKKIPFIDDNGKLVNPTEPNGIKLETFVFDALPLAKKSIIFETLREQEFAPVKNAQGADSPEVTKKMMAQRDKNWIKNAGITVPDSCTVEISPLFAISNEDIKDKVSKLPKFEADKQYYIE